MSSLNFMVIAGEPSGDLLAAELVRALKASPEADGARFFGAGGMEMAAAGVELAFDMTQHAVVGGVEVLKHLRIFKQRFDQLVELAFERRPDVIVCVDFSVFNHRFARKIRWELEVRRTAHGNWKPKIVKYVSPQVWASRPGRAKSMARNFDLLLTIFPFEKPWYAERVPELRVEFVGHPMCDRFSVERSSLSVERSTPLILLLPGSRAGELKRHLPVMRDAIRIIRASPQAAFRMVLPNDALAAQARQELAEVLELELRVGGLREALAEATVAIASTGTVTMECAYFGVPTVTLYKTSWLTYQVARRLVNVTSLTMPNLLAGETIFPEFVQGDATAKNIARAALDLLGDAARREATKKQLEVVIQSLGGPGASRRAGEAILALLNSSRTKCD